MENQEFNNKLEPVRFLRSLCAVVEKMNFLVEIGGFCFYDENGIICKYDFGYFDNDYILEFNGKVIRKLKESFTSKENYVIKEKKDYSWQDTTYILYIYKDNVNLEYKGMDKKFGSVYDIYSVNGKTEFGVFLRSLQDKKYELEALIEKEKEKIKTYDLPLPENEMKSICDNLIKYNTLLIQEKERIKNYIPTEQDRIFKK